MKIYTLTIIKEIIENPADVEITLYANPKEAIKTYSVAVDKARIEAKEYEKPYEEKEVVTDTPYRWYGISDLAGYHESIIIELHEKEVL